MYSENYLPHYFWVKSKIENKKLVEIVLKWNL